MRSQTANANLQASENPDAKLFDFAGMTCMQLRSTIALCTACPNELKINRRNRSRQD